jgi:hypothetical protein
MAELNLLPKERTGSKDVVGFLSLTKKVSIALLIILVLVVGVGGAIYFLSVRDQSRLQLEYENLENQAQSLEATEAGLVLLKDRLQKSQTVISSRAAEESFSKQKAIVEFAPDEVTFKESIIDSANSTLEIETQNSNSLVSLMSEIFANSNNFSEIAISELTFSAAVGYAILLTVF